MYRPIYIDSLRQIIMSGINSKVTVIMQVGHINFGGVKYRKGRPIYR